jgi:DNA-binding transcriptional MerR regulator
MKPKRYTIEELGNISGFTRRTIRYYIQEGLVKPPAGRGRGGFYFDSHLETLHRIRLLQAEHLGLKAIQEILKGGDEQSGEREDRTEAAVASLQDEATCRSSIPCGRPSTALHAAIHGERRVCVKYEIRPGIEIHVDRDLEEAEARRVAEIVRVARSILRQGRK